MKGMHDNLKTQKETLVHARRARWHFGLLLLHTRVGRVARTMTREAQRASRPAWAAGGATSVPSDHSATPASSTRAPPILPESGVTIIGFQKHCLPFFSS